MNVASSVAFAVAERVERSGGPKAGLVAWRKLADSSRVADVRARALLAALRCAFALRDREALTELAITWQAVEDGLWDEPIAALCKEMVKAGALASAIELAHAETRRHATARGLYLYARCLDVAGDRGAADAFAAATSRAEKEGAREVERASRVRRCAWLVRSYETLSEAIDEAKRVDLASASAQEKLVVAGVLLAAASRYVRATAIGLLDEIVQGPDRALAARALLMCARYADAAVEKMSALELDRLVAVFGREQVVRAAPQARDVLRASRALVEARTEEELDVAASSAVRLEPSLAALHTRARDIVRGRYEAHLAVGASSSRDRFGDVLDLAVAMRDGAPARAAKALRALAEAAERGERVPPQAFLLVERALTSEAAEVRSAAGRFVAARLAKTESGAPPGGWLALSTVLMLASMDELAATARRAAAVAKEPGATDELALSLTRSAWRLAAEGDRARALTRLREAKAIASSDGGVKARG